MCSDKKPNIHDVVENLRQPMPVTKKVGLVIKNNLLKMLKLKNCCGHYGQPGC